jgi:hypothetical protein
MVAKKTVTKKPVKKVAHKRSTSAKTAPMRSFRVYKDDKPFVRLRLTRQTLYWIILLTFIVITQLWIIKIQMDIINLTALLSHP